MPGFFMVILNSGHKLNHLKPYLYMLLIANAVVFL